MRADSCFVSGFTLGIVDGMPFMGEDDGSRVTGKSLFVEFVAVLEFLHHSNTHSLHFLINGRFSFDV